MKFDRNFLKLNTHPLTVTDFSFDVTR